MLGTRQDATELEPADVGGAPAVMDPQFDRLLELYAGTHIDPRSRVGQVPSRLL
jgi:hypothetical protein